MEAQKQAASKARAVAKLQEIKDRFNTEQQKAKEKEMLVSISTEQNSKLKSEVAALKKTEMDFKTEVKLQREELLDYKNKMELAEKEIIALKKELHAKYKEVKDKAGVMYAVQEKNEPGVVTPANSQLKRGRKPVTESVMHINVNDMIDENVSTPRVNTLWSTNGVESKVVPLDKPKADIGISLTEMLHCSIKDSTIQQPSTPIASIGMHV